MCHFLPRIRADAPGEDRDDGHHQHQQQWWSVRELLSHKETETETEKEKETAIRTIYIQRKYIHGVTTKFITIAIAIAIANQERGRGRGGTKQRQKK